MSHKLMSKKIASAVASLGFLLSLSLLVTNVNAQVSPPDFPACTQQDGPGDRANYESGIHQIVGDGLLEGSDNVYTLESGNYIQCYCPEEGDDGIQTDWWRIDELTEEKIQEFIDQGWIFVQNGLVWNLEDTSYLARNSESSCAEPTPTPTPTSPPGPPGPPPVCEGKDLGAYAPTITEIKRVDADTVHACWTASTPNADDYIVYYGMSKDNLTWNTKVENGQCVDLHGVPGGRIFIKVAATDNCVVGPFSSIDEQTPQVLAATITSLPKTGAPLALVLGLTAISGLGTYLYKRFKLA